MPNLRLQSLYGPYVVLQNDALFEPVGATPSTHILKPDHPDEDYPHSVINEWFVMCLAKRLGLNVPNVHRRYVPSPIYLIDRFDRFSNKQGWQMLAIARLLLVLAYLNGSFL